MRPSSCRRTTELANQLSLDDLPPSLALHLPTCLACQDELWQLTALAAAARDLPDQQLAEETHKVQRARLLAQLQPPLAPRRLTWGFAAAAALLSVGIWVLWSRQAERLALESPRAVVEAPFGASFTHTRSVDATDHPDEQVRLREGRISLEVKKLRPGERFRVVASDGEVEVRGTSFEVVVVHDQLRRVSVRQGRVEVRPAGAALIVLSPGESWEAQPAVQGSQAPLMTPPPGPAPLPVPDVAPPKPPSISRDATPEPPRSEIARGEPTPVPSAEGTPPIPPLPPPRPASLAESSFQVGWGALQAGATGEAISRFEAVLRENPNAALAEDATFWRAVALGLARRNVEAEEAMRQYLARYPASPRIGELSVMLGRLLLEKRDLDGARQRFQAALNNPREPIRRRAREGLSALEGNAP